VNGYDFDKRQGASVGAVLLLLKVAQDLGIRQALGEDEDGKLALWQEIARCLDQGSRLSAVRLASPRAGVGDRLVTFS